MLMPKVIEVSRGSAHPSRPPATKAAGVGGSARRVLSIA
jgi:hypothetical protein